MKPQNVVEFADRIARKRAAGAALATTIFLAIQIVARPVFRDDAYGAAGPRGYMWAINVAALLLLLLPAAGFVWGARVRALVNDEISRANSRTAAAAGFWVAMLTGLAVYALPAARGLSAREVSYLVVTLGTSAALLTFAGLEVRALRDG